MELCELASTDAILMQDGSFDVLAPCTTQINKNILTYVDDNKYLDSINSNSRISCVICRSEHVKLINNKKIGIIVCEQPRVFFFKLHNQITKNEVRTKYKTSVGTACQISTLAFISNTNVNIGDNVTIEEYVSIKENVKIGNNCIIRAGTIIGGQGFEFKKNEQTDILSVIHAGNTIIERDVEIKELCSIHQAVFSWDCTRIDEYSKIDANSHIGHSTKIGKRVLIGSHGNLAGNIIIGDDVYLGPNVTISNRISVGSESRISLGSVVTKNVPERKTVTGNFAIDHSIFMKNLKNVVNKNEPE